MRRPERRKGFTLIEILVVMGILMLLAGITVIGFRQLAIGSKRTATESMMVQCRSFLTEYETKNRLVGIPTVAVAAPGSVEDVDGGTAGDRYNSVAVTSTSALMGRLQGIPENRAMLAKVPNEKLLKRVAGKVDNPILLDAWGNPIIFVPAGGLSGVTISGTTGRTVTSRGVIPDGGTLPAGVRPFWASAGPDGDFSKGDDNLYSFEKQ